jgi:hypothetical protein
LIAIDDDKVRFRWKDYRRDNRHATMTLTADEFIRRFLVHVLPSGFQRIRYYGFLCNRRRRDKLARCRQMLGMASVVPAASDTSDDYRDVYEAVTGNSLRRCPSCDDGFVARHQGSTALKQPPVVLRHVMTARADRHVQLSEPAPPRRVDGDLTPHGITVPLAVIARGANPTLGEDFRPVAWKFRPRQGPQTDLCAPETVTPAYNAHRLSLVPAA